MSPGGLLQTVIGLMLIYLVVSIIASGVNEFIAQELGRRGRFLREGMINVVRDRWIYLRIINHPLLASLYRDLPGKVRPPSYIPPGNFAQALLDVVMLKASQLDRSFAGKLGPERTIADVRLAAQTCKAAGYTIGDALVPLIDGAQGSLDTATKNLEGWYESSMERVTGWYKRETRRTLFAIGLAVAVLFNVDTIGIVSALAENATLRASVAETASNVVATKQVAGVPVDSNDPQARVALDQLKKLTDEMTRFEQQGLPVGFSCLNDAQLATADGLRAALGNCWQATLNEKTGSWFLRIIGWLLTALAISLGAPFWFDLLNKVANLRGAGPKPPAPATQPG